MRKKQKKAKKLFKTRCLESLYFLSRLLKVLFLNKLNIPVKKPIIRNGANVTYTNEIDTLISNNFNKAVNKNEAIFAILIQNMQDAQA